MSPASPEETRALELLRTAPYGRLSVSIRALPFVTPARHIVTDGTVLLRMHRGFGYHRACDGHVVGYGADNLDHGSEDVWAVQFVGTAHAVEPGPQVRELFGRPPRRADDAPFDPVYLRIAPRFVTVHSLAGVPPRPNRYAA